MTDKNESQVQRNCALCAKPDEHDDMVACDSCQLWHHYSCANVDACVMDREWKCTTCTAGLKGAKPKNTGIPSENLNVPARKSGAKSSAGSKPSRKSKKVVGEQSITSSARMRLELELKAVEEQRKLQEEELAAEKELMELERKLEEELREQELAIEAKRIAEAKAALKKKMSDEREFKMKQMVIRRRSEEEKAMLIRQASEYGSSRGSLVGTNTDSKDKVEDWLEKSTQQTAGPLKESTSAVDHSNGLNQVSFDLNTNRQNANFRAARSLEPPPLTIRNKNVSTKTIPENTIDSQVDRGQQSHTNVIDNRCFVEEFDELEVGDVQGDHVNTDSCNLKLLVGGIPRVNRWENRYRASDREHETDGDPRNSVRRDLRLNEVVMSGINANNPRSYPAQPAENADKRKRSEYNEHFGQASTSQIGAGVGMRSGQPAWRNSESTNQTRLNDDQHMDGPTNRQLAARQVMGKDLPYFSGNPEEWPIWISNFRRSTSTCGFSDDENLIRLQRCLKGSALEAVRSRLLCPASVPHVIRTLEMRYGRPETLIRSMTERVRRLPPLKINDLDGVIEFGLVVDNLVQHLKNAEQQAHLSNPSLLHDLVGKLPVDYKLKWSAYKSMQFNADLDTFGQFMSTLVELAYDVADDFSSEKIQKQKQKHKDRTYVQTRVVNVNQRLTPFR